MSEPISSQSSGPRGQTATTYYDHTRVRKHIKTRYVAWIDLMGARGIMGRSLPKAANFIGKIHEAILSQCNEQSLENGHTLTPYPVIDGAYITSKYRADLDICLSGIMRRLAETFVKEQKQEHRFLVRGGIAFGDILEGAHLAKGSDTLRKSERYSHCVALGSAIGQAYSAESLSPPFGFCVDITARSISTPGQPTYPSLFWRWWSDAGEDGLKQASALASKLDEYFKWLSDRLLEHEYPKDRFERHKALMQEYFRA